MATPTHIGFILDGNRRWAKSKGLDSLEGHRAGYENLKKIGRAGIKRGIKYMTAYVFSTENWNRTRREVNYLMKLLHSVFLADLESFHRDGIRILVSGRRDKLGKQITKDIDAAVKKTAKNKKATLVLALNYGGRQEITDAVKKIVSKKIPVSKITETTITDNLYNPEVPDPDLIIRTSGEQRLSSFMMWESGYSELYFTKKHWPDFSPRDLDGAIAEFNKRKRRFGR